MIVAERSSPASVSDEDASDDSELIQVLSKLDLLNSRVTDENVDRVDSKITNSGGIVDGPSSATSTLLPASSRKQEKCDLLEETMVMDICEICGGILDTSWEEDGGGDKAERSSQLDGLLCTCTAADSVWDMTMTDQEPV